MGYSYYNNRRKKRILKVGILALFVLAVIIIIISATKGDKKNIEPEVNVELPPKKEYNIPPASEENDLLKIATTVAETDDKICYLTFDDGPTKEVTPKVLEVLRQYNVKATFFMLGKLLDANPDIAKQVYEEGHLLSNHSYNHNYDSLYATAESFMDEINRTTAKIQEITGEEPFKLMRFPGGSHNAGSYAAQKQEYKKVLRDNGYYYVDWNCLNGDAEAALRSSEALLSRIKETAVGKNIVVLMHDASTKTTTPESLGAVIEYLRSQGYEFKRLDEVEYYDDGTLDVDEGAMIL